MGKFFEGQKKFDIVVRLNDNYREDLNEIALIPVSIAGNKTIPLKDVAKIRFKDNYSSYSREQAKRRIAVLINPRGKDTEAFVNEAKEKISKDLKLPDGIFLEWGGNFKNLKEARERLYILGPLTLFLILLMIHAAFGKVWQTALVACTVPLAIVGGLISLSTTISRGIAVVYSSFKYKGLA